MPPVSKPTVKSAADLEAERAAQAAAEEGSSPAETEAAATEAAEQEVRQVAPGLSDEQVEKIAAASGKAAAQETIAEMRRIGAIREEEMTSDAIPPTVPPTLSVGAASDAASAPAGTAPDVPAPPPPPAGATPQQIEIQQEPPKKLTPAERFVGRK